MTYKLRKRAEADLAEIWRYTALRWNVDQAETYLGRIFATFDVLASNPDAGRSCDDIRAGYLRKNIGAHVIFFRIADERVEIVRVLHGRRDFRRLLPKG